MWDLRVLETHQGASGDLCRPLAGSSPGCSPVWFSEGSESFFGGWGDFFSCFFSCLSLLLVLAAVTGSLALEEDGRKILNIHAEGVRGRAHRLPFLPCAPHTWARAQPEGGRRPHCSEGCSASRPLRVYLGAHRSQGKLPTGELLPTVQQHCYCFHFNNFLLKWFLTRDMNVFCYWNRTLLARGISVFTYITSRLLQKSPGQWCVKCVCDACSENLQILCFKATSFEGAVSKDSRLDR